MSKKIRKSQINEVKRVCRDCAHVEVVTKHNTLTIDGHKPTLGRCPYHTGGKYCVLLSQRSCNNFIKKSTI